MALNCSLQSDLNHSTWGRETLQPQHPTACAPCDFGRISLLLQTGDPDRIHLVTQIVCESLCEAVALHSGDRISTTSPPARADRVGAGSRSSSRSDASRSPPSGRRSRGVRGARSPICCGRSSSEAHRGLAVDPDGSSDLFRVMGRFVARGWVATVWGTGDAPRRAVRALCERNPHRAEDVRLPLSRRALDPRRCSVATTGPSTRRSRRSMHPASGELTRPSSSCSRVQPWRSRRVGRAAECHLQAVIRRA